MENILKAASAVMVILVLNGILRQFSPTFALSISVLGAAVILLFTIPYLSEIIEKIKDFSQLSSVSNELFSPLLKVTAVAVIGKTVSELCKDSGENALAHKIELLCTAISVIFTLPLLEKTLTLIGGA